MIKIETLNVCGFGPALTAMRNPFDSWLKSDTVNADTDIAIQIGDADRDLSARLQKAGPEHC